jgi:hypothetical protein
MRARIQGRIIAKSNEVKRLYERGLEQFVPDLLQEVEGACDSCDPSVLNTPQRSKVSTTSLRENGFVHRW